MMLGFGFVGVILMLLFGGGADRRGNLDDQNILSKWPEVE